MASGSEVQIALAARETLQAEGIGARVVSVPCLDWFEAQDADYIECVLPQAVTARVSVEAAIAQPWWRWIGSQGRPVSLEHYGASADAATLYREFGITADAAWPPPRNRCAAGQRRPTRSPQRHDVARRRRERLLTAHRHLQKEAEHHDRSTRRPHRAGVSLWLDDLSRQRLHSGNLAELIATRHIVGVTTNPSIFAGGPRATATSYQQQLDELAARGADVDDAVRAVTTDDVRNACDLFTGVFAATDGVDGRVSIEVDPRLAHDTAGHRSPRRKELHKIVDRPNVLIKIPATVAGLPAITAVIGRGHQRQRHADLLPRAVRGRDRCLPDRPGAGRRGNGHDLAKIHSVASFFVSRVDTEIDNRLEAHRLPGGAGAARSGRHRQRPAGVPAVRADASPATRWEELAAAGAQQAAPAVGVHRRQGPEVRRHPLRRRAGRPATRSTPPRRRPSTPSPTTA